MGSLETRLSRDAGETAKTMAAQERARLMADMGGGEGAPKTRSEWLELLRRQDALHKLEMERWQEVLSVASELLKKVQYVKHRIVLQSIIDSYRLKSP